MLYLNRIHFDCAFLRTRMIAREKGGGGWIIIVCLSGYFASYGKIKRICSTSKSKKQIQTKLTHLLKTAIPPLDLTSLGSMADRCGTRMTPRNRPGSLGFKSRLISIKGVPLTSSNCRTSSVNRSLQETLLKLHDVPLNKWVTVRVHIPPCCGRYYGLRSTRRRGRASVVKDELWEVAVEELHGGDGALGADAVRVHAAVVERPQLSVSCRSFSCWSGRGRLQIDLLN